MSPHRLLPCPAPRWHVEPITNAAGETVHVIVRRCSPSALPIVVRPTRPGFANAVRIADAINRAYEIEPVSGFDVSGLTGLALRPDPPPPSPYDPHYTSAERGQRDRAERRASAPITAPGHMPPS